MKIYNISVPKKYTKNGEEKTMWNTVGKLIEWPETTSKEKGYTLELSMFPDTKFGVFPQEAKEEKKPEVSEQDKAEQEAYDRAYPKQPLQTPAGIDYPTEDINPADIPF